MLRPECWFAMCYSKAECSLRVVRAELDDGQRVIGVRFPPVLIAVAEKTAADETRMRQQLTVYHPASTHCFLTSTIIIIIIIIIIVVVAVLLHLSCSIRAPGR